MNAQFTQGFETSLTSDGFSTSSPAITGNWTQSSFTAHTGLYCARYYNDTNISANYNISQTLKTPIITVVANVSDKFSFWVRKFSYNNTSTNRITIYKINSTNLSEIPINSSYVYDYWTKITVDLRSFIGQSFILGFKGGIGINDNRSVYIDDIVNDGYSLCPPTQTQPFIESFDESNTVPNCWSLIGNNGSWDFNDDIARKILQSNFNDSMYLVTPKLQINSGLIDNISFLYRVSNEFNLDYYLKVRISTTSTAISDFSTVIYSDYNLIHNVTKNASIDLSAYVGQSVYLAFEGNILTTGFFGSSELLIDNVSTCGISTPVVSLFTLCDSSSPTLNFSNLPSTGTWTLYQFGFDTPIATGTGSTAAVSTINPADVYKFYVKQDQCVSQMSNPNNNILNALNYPVMTGNYVDFNTNGVLDIGDKINYTIRVTNSGICPRTGITINKIVNSISNPNLNFSGNSFVLLPTIPGFGFVDTSCSYLITQTDITNGFVNNTSTVSGVWTGYSFNYTPQCYVPLNNLGTENFKFTNLKYFPNPVKNSFSISNQSIIDKVEVTSVLGQKIMNKSVNDLLTEINFSDFANGVYFVKIYSEGQSKTIRIVKE